MSRWSANRVRNRREKICGRESGVNHFVFDDDPEGHLSRWPFFVQKLCAPHGHLTYAGGGARATWASAYLLTSNSRWSLKLAASFGDFPMPASTVPSDLPSV